MFSVLLKGGYVIDGTGNPWIKEDVAIGDGKILRIGNLSCMKAEKTVDAKGLVVSPGFIDIHSHSGFTLLVNPLAESKIRQGVTTEVIGNCGFSPAPVSETAKELYKKSWPWTFLAEAKLKWDWSSMREYLDRLDKKRIAVNIVPLVGHDAIRTFVMELENRRPTKKELDKMKALIAQAMEEGAFGMSSGLIYPPGCYAHTSELVELCKVVAKYRGFYASHIRGESDTVLEAVREAVEIGKVAEVPVEISHLKMAGKENWGKTEKILKIITEARAKGVDVTFDVYPYTAGSFGLSAMLPPWVHEGGVEPLVRRLNDPTVRERLRRDMLEGSPDWSSPLKAAGWDATIIVYCKKVENRKYEGRTIEEIAKFKEVDPFDFVFDLLITEEMAVNVVRFSMHEEDVRALLRYPVAMIGSDSQSVAPYGVLSGGTPHPRYYGTFPRVLGKYVREEGVLTLEDAIRKMTSLPAQRLRLRDRGLIRTGMYADITIFDPKRVLDKATFAESHRYAEGIVHVLVNGEMVIDNGAHTGAFPGRVLRRGGFR
jgi:N-acyl-D-amino-acid deacylase